MSIMSAILEKEPEAISTINPVTPPLLDHIVRRCLAKIPDERWSSGAAFSGLMRGDLLRPGQNPWRTRPGHTHSPALRVRGFFPVKFQWAYCLVLRYAFPVGHVEVTA